jgi:hypothetical protein
MKNLFFLNMIVGLVISGATTGIAQAMEERRAYGEYERRIEHCLDDMACVGRVLLDAIEEREMVKSVRDNRRLKSEPETEPETKLKTEKNGIEILSSKVGGYYCTARSIDLTADLQELCNGKESCLVPTDFEKLNVPDPNQNCSDQMKVTFRCDSDGRKVTEKRVERKGLGSLMSSSDLNLDCSFSRRGP